MTASGDLRVVFCTTAGPRRGFGHLVRCLSLARALGVRPLLALRGNARTLEAALGLGADLLASSTRPGLSAMHPDVVIVDDPIVREGRLWVDTARRLGAHVVTVHDLGLGCADGDLIVDGSVARTAHAPRDRRSLAGTRFAILDPSVAGQAVRPRRVAHRVLIALGGGPHVRMALAIAEVVIAAVPHAEVRIATGFAARRAAAPAVSPRITLVTPTRGLAAELSRADVAVVGGGVSLYEACALGVPSVGIPVVKSQVPTIEAFVRRRAAVGVARRTGPGAPAALVVALLGDGGWRRRLSRASRLLVDGRGAARVAAAIDALGRSRVRPARLAGSTQQDRGYAYIPSAPAGGRQPDRGRAA